MKKFITTFVFCALLASAGGSIALAQTQSYSSNRHKSQQPTTSTKKSTGWKLQVYPYPPSTSTAPVASSTPVTTPVTTPVVSTPTSTPVTTAPLGNALQWGAFTGNTTPVGNWQGLFVGDGDSFTADAQGLTKPLVVYWESNYTASQIANGSADSFLKSWATQMVAYKQPIIFNVLDEMNGNWSAYYGNPTEFISAYQHVHSFFASGTNVKFAYDPNAADSATPVSTFTSYYPGDAYVDIVGLDGFDFGGQTFSQVFQPSIQAMKADFPSKPLWILSTGVVNTDNQSAFTNAMASAAGTYGIQGIIYFDYQQFVIPASTLSTSF